MLPKFLLNSYVWVATTQSKFSLLLAYCRSTVPNKLISMKQP